MRRTAITPTPPARSSGCSTHRLDLPHARGLTVTDHWLDLAVDLSLVAISQPLVLPDRDGQPERGGIRRGLSVVGRHSPLARYRRRKRPLGRLDTLEPRPHGGIVDFPTRTDRTLGRGCVPVSCSSQCDTVQSLMPEAQRWTPDCERVSQKVAASGRFWEGLDCQFAPLQAGPHKRSQARVKHHNALICTVICRWTSTDRGTGICNVRLPFRHGRDRRLCHSQSAWAWVSGSSRHRRRAWTICSL